MSDASNRNARCHCGSGKKFKNCHGAASTGAGGRKLPLGYLLAGAAVVAVAAFALMRQSPGNGPGSAPPGKVWSAEHGHWHDAP